MFRSFPQQVKLTIIEVVLEAKKSKFKEKELRYLSAAKLHNSG